MSPPDDFFAMLSSLLQQMAHNPEAPATIPLNHWSSETPERRLLEDLQTALAALQSGGQNRSSLSEERERRYQSIFEAARDGLIVTICIPVV